MKLPVRQNRRQKDNIKIALRNMAWTGFSRLSDLQLFSSYFIVSGQVAPRKKMREVFFTLRPYLPSMMYSYQETEVALLALGGKYVAQGAPRRDRTSDEAKISFIACTL